MKVPVTLGAACAVMVSLFLATPAQANTAGKSGSAIHSHGGNHTHAHGDHDHAHDDLTLAHDGNWADDRVVGYAKSYGAGDKQVIVPSKNIVIGQSFSVIGKVAWKKGQPKRTVKVQQRSGKKWVTVKSAKVGAAKRIKYTGKAKKATTLKFRVIASPIKKHRVKKSVSKVASVKVVAKVAPEKKVAITVPPMGFSSDWAEPWVQPELGVLKEPRSGYANDWAWFTKSQARWSNCDVITWTYDPTLGYESAFNDLQRSFARISALSGLRFQYLGSHRPASIRADMQISWATSAVFPETAIAGRTETWTPKSDNSSLVYADMILNADMPLEESLYPSYVGYKSWGQVMQHEIGHALGLGHAKGGDQIMNAYVNENNYRFGNGDVKGFSVMGQKTC